MNGLRILAALAFAVLMSMPLAARPVLISAQPIAGAPAGARAYEIRYRSTGVQSQPIETTGVIIVPAQPAQTGGRDVIAWAHGTSGIADACAPTRND